MNPTYFERTILTLFLFLCLFSIVFSEEVFSDSKNISFDVVCVDSVCNDINMLNPLIKSLFGQRVSVKGSFYNPESIPSELVVTDSLKSSVLFTEIADPGETVNFEVFLDGNLKELSIVARAKSIDRISFKNLYLRFEDQKINYGFDSFLFFGLSVVFFIVCAFIAFLLRHFFKWDYSPNKNENNTVKIAGAVVFAVFIIFVWVKWCASVSLFSFAGIFLINFGFGLMVFTAFYFLSNKMIEQERNSTFFIAGICAAILSFFVNTFIFEFAVALTQGNLGNYSGLISFASAVSIAPLVEELSKGLFLIALLIVLKQSVPEKGFFFGALTGFGFTLLENVIYSIQYAPHLGGVFGDLSLILLRAASPAHLFFTGITGFLFLYFKQKTNSSLLSFIGAVGVAIFLHSLFNFFASFLWIFNILLIICLIFALFVFSRIHLNMKKL